MSAQRFFTAEISGDVLVVSPSCDVAGADQDAVHADVAVLLAMLSAAELRHVVVDFQAVPFFGSEMLETLLALWRDARSRGGRLAVCNLSAEELDLIATVKFDSLWPTASTREQAIAAVHRR